MSQQLRFIDLFAGLGGIRLGVEQACQEQGIEPVCVFTSEIKTSAIACYQANFANSTITGDITSISSEDIPDCDLLLAGFPCQPFSSAGSRQGFMDTRGTLFFDIERILAEKQPQGFLLENVEGLVNHDRGRTLATILQRLQALGYQVTWKVLNAKDFAVPQDRKRIFLIGNKRGAVSLEHFPKEQCTLGDILERGLPSLETTFTRCLLDHFSLHELAGKSIKDKRGGANNIHSWDIELKGSTSTIQRRLLGELLKQRRKKIWADRKGIAWMDGMPLTLEEISSFFLESNRQELQDLLDDLVDKGYLRFEHPKDLVEIIDDAGRSKKIRQYTTSSPKGYNIVVGKLSFEINKILHPDEISPTLVATDLSRLAVIDGSGIRRLSIREGLRLSGFPESYTMPVPTKHAYDLLGNTVVVSVVRAIIERYLHVLQGKPSYKAVEIYQQSLFHHNELPV